MPTQIHTFTRQHNSHLNLHAIHTHNAHTIHIPKRPYPGVHTSHIPKRSHNSYTKRPHKLHT